MTVNFEGLSLANEEDDGGVFHRMGGLNQATNFDLCLLGRFLSDRTIRVNVMKEVMGNVWRPAG